MTAWDSLKIHLTKELVDVKDHPVQGSLLQDQVLHRLHLEEDVPLQELCLQRDLKVPPTDPHHYLCLYLLCCVAAVQQ